MRIFISFLEAGLKLFIFRLMQAWLEDQNGRRFECNGNCSIGRLPGSGVTLDDRQVSRQHALIIAQPPGGHWLVDFGSRNGTRLNGIAVIEPRRLKNGDLIEINTHKLLFREPGHHRQSVSNPHGAAWEETEKKFAAYQITSQGVIVLARDGTVQTISPHASEWLACYFPKSPANNGPLPATLSDWLKQHQGKVPGQGSLTRLGSPLVLMRGDKRLRVQLADAGGGQQVMLFSEEDFLVTQSQIQRLGLTPRESQVLLWLAEGKTNAEIGMVLKMSPRTVEKHVAQILVKLEVENRASAIIRAMEFCARANCGEPGV
jgi:DNA-binding CsgD family transcriptional regulator